LATTSTPSPAKDAIASANHRPRRPVSAHHHTYPIEDKKPIEISACIDRHMTTAGVITLFDPTARLLRTQQPYPPNEGCLERCQFWAGQAPGLRFGRFGGPDPSLTHVDQLITHSALVRRL
jgi:hypothetical protein